MKLTKTAIILFSFITIFSACSFEDEIEPYHGQFTVINSSNSSFDLTIENTNLKDQVAIIEETIEGNTSIYIPLDKGYIYDVKASEVKNGQPSLSVYSTSITIEAHIDSEWTIPTE